jgi:hypothetical protein
MSPRARARKGTEVQELLHVADYDAVLHVFAERLANGSPVTVAALTAEAERVIALEATAATVHEVVSDLVGTGFCTRKGQVLTPATPRAAAGGRGGDAEAHPRPRGMDAPLREGVPPLV